MKYRTIVADPPWCYDEGWPQTNWTTEATPRRPLPYPSMTLDEIQDLPMEVLCDKDTHLFVWTTNRYLIPCHDIVREWGFIPSQTLVWCKPPMGIGPGGLFAQTAEFIVYARRGKPKGLHRQASSWWNWPRRGHSVKPEAFLDLVEQACPGPYLELFARRQRLGWDTWGDEAFNHVELEVKP